MSEKVFISYAQQDRFFGEFLETKLSASGISVWRDATSLIPGKEWRNSIDVGLNDCRVVILVLSVASCGSQYVTYEWSYAMGRDKSIVPVLLEDCDRHPKIEPIQYVDFRMHNDATWEKLISRVCEVMGDDSGILDTQKDVVENPAELSDKEKVWENKIIAYLQERGFRLVSFQKIQEVIVTSADDDQLTELVNKSSRFRHATLKGFKAGLGML